MYVLKRQTKQLSTMQKDVSKLTQTRTSVDRRETPLTRVVSFRLSRVSRSKERENAPDLISNSKYSTLYTKSLKCLCKWITAVKKQPPKRLRGQYPNVSIYHQRKHREPNGYFLQNICLNK